jgi:hypothetical protein
MKSGGLSCRQTNSGSELARVRPVDHLGHFIEAQEFAMPIRIALATAIALTATSAIAGPCTQRLADLEKSITAQQEGAGPALANPTITGSTASTSQGQSSGVNVTGQSQGANQAMQMIQQAKQMDQQGKEAECMDMATKISSMAPPSTK